MIIDSIKNINQYTCAHPLFAKAINYIQSTNFSDIEPGTYVVEENNIKAIVSDGMGKTREQAQERFECHNQFIDIQLLINGVEEMGWKPRGNCVSPQGDYNAEKDVLFYYDAPDMFFTLHPSQFVIFFPEDVHAPMISAGAIKKLVMKIKLNN
ncbi:MAG: YhcH/YjgK/YiaL family protein [Niabella sp.]